MKESEWKKFKKLRALCLERFCGDVLHKAENICNADGTTAHDRYGGLYRLIWDKDKDLAKAFDGPSRNRAITQLMLMYRFGFVEEDELNEFENETQTFIRDIASRG